MAQPNQPPPGYGFTHNYPASGLGGPNPGYASGNYGYDNSDAADTEPKPAYVGGSYGYDYSGVGMGPSTRHSDRMEDYPVEGMNAASFSDKAIRRAFIRKVYLILTAQLLVTVAFIAVFIFVKPIKDWVQTDGLWFYIVAYVTFLITYIVLVCCSSVRRKYPGNFICLAVFTVAFSYMTGTISSFHDTEIVLLAAGITAAVCISISIFAIQTKIDFTMCSGLLFALLMVLFFFGWSCLIVYYTWGYNHILNCVYAGLGAIVFSLFLIYDTQMIMGGKKIELSPEEYIYGALQLYIDVVYIFLYLLAFFGKSN